MTDKVLFQQIRQIVKAQKKNTLDVKSQNFVQPYCKSEMLKKTKIKPSKHNPLNTLKNFSKVESYINIMDIIKQLPQHFNYHQQAKLKKQEASDLIPQSMQDRIKEILSPVLIKRYQQQRESLQQLKNQVKQNTNFTNLAFANEIRQKNQINQVMQKNGHRSSFEAVNILRKDIRRKPIYFLQKRFDQELKEISATSGIVQNNKIFHKICTYLQMILQQQHRQKWACKKDIQLRQELKNHISRNKYKMSTRVKNALQPTLRFTTSKTRSQENSRSVSKFEHQKMQKNDRMQSLRQSCNQFGTKIAKNQSKIEQLKQSFTFKNRAIKAGILSKLNQFVDKIKQQQKSNCKLIKKYSKAMKSLQQQNEMSYCNFRQEELINEYDIKQMKKYVDNSLGRNKHNLKKLHRHI